MKSIKIALIGLMAIFSTACSAITGIPDDTPAPEPTAVAVATTQPTAVPTLIPPAATSAPAPAQPTSAPPATTAAPTQALPTVVAAQPCVLPVVGTINLDPTQCASLQATAITVVAQATAQAPKPQATAIAGLPTPRPTLTVGDTKGGITALAPPAQDGMVTMGGIQWYHVGGEKYTAMSVGCFTVPPGARLDTPGGPFYVKDRILVANATLYSQSGPLDRPEKEIKKLC